MNIMLPCNNLVSLESLYGMCVLLPSTKADITLPKVERDKLIFVASFSLSPYKNNNRITLSNIFLSFVGNVNF